MVKNESGRTPDVGRMTPGVFTEAQSGKRIFYAARMDKVGDMEDVFMSQLEAGKRAVVVARTGHPFIDEKTGDKFLALRDGRVYNGEPGEAKYQVLRFETFNVRLEPKRLEEPPSTVEGLGNRELLARGDGPAIAEFHWRIGKPIAVFVLALYALVLAHTDAPRAAVQSVRRHPGVSHLFQSSGPGPDVAQERPDFAAGGSVVAAHRHGAGGDLPAAPAGEQPAADSAAEVAPMILSILDRHIGRGIFISTVLVFGVLLALSIFIVFVRAMADFGKFNFGLPELAHYVIMSQPRQLYELFPIIVLIGAIMGLSAMALNSELIAMRAAGVSVARIVGSAMKAGLMFVIASVLLGEYVVPFAESVAQRERAQALHESLQQRSSGLWLRDGEAFVNIGEVLPDLSLLRVNIYHFSDSTRLRSQTFASRAKLEGEQWRLEGVRQSFIQDQSVRFQHARAQVWDTALTRDVVSVFAVVPEGLSIQQLYRYIEHLRQNNQEIERYQLAFWQKIFMPLATAVMVLLATPFVFRPVRSGGLGQRVFLGVMLGLAFVVLNQIIGYFGLLYGLSPVVSALTPILLFLGLALVLLRRSAH